MPDRNPTTPAARGFTTAPCRGCGRPIVWAVDPLGRRIPLDPTPPVYHVQLEATDNPGSARASRSLTAMVSHFATCPEASRFSGSSRRQPDPIRDRGTSSSSGGGQ